MTTPQKKWPQQVLAATSQLLNAIAFGWCDEMLSSRAYRLGYVEDKTFWFWVAFLLDLIFYKQQEHCKDSYLWEQAMRETPPEYRDG